MCHILGTLCMGWAAYLVWRQSEEGPWPQCTERCAQRLSSWCDVYLVCYALSCILSVLCSVLWTVCSVQGMFWPPRAVFSESCAQGMLSKWCAVHVLCRVSHSVLCAMLWCPCVMVCVSLVHDLLSAQCVVCPYKDEEWLPRGTNCAPALSQRQVPILTKVNEYLGECSVFNKR